MTYVSLPNKIIKEKDKEVNCGNFLSINEHNFLNLIERIIFQKWYTQITLVVNKELSSTEIALIDSRVDMNYIQDRLVPSKYYEKSIGRLTQANGEKLKINYVLKLLYE